MLFKTGEFPLFYASHLRVTNNKNQLPHYQKKQQRQIKDKNIKREKKKELFGPSKYMKTPSFLRQGLRCRTMTAGNTFFLKSGFPFLTVAMTMSPTQADGSLLRRPLIPFTEMM